MILRECRPLREHYRKLDRIEEGTYGIVYRAEDLHTGEIVALKQLKLEKEREGFPVTSLREISAMMRMEDHPNIVRLREIVVGRDNGCEQIYMVLDYVDHDLRTLLDERLGHSNGPFSMAETKSLLKQLLTGVAAMHERWLVHRDIKTTNILVSKDGVLRIADFGLARLVGSHNYNANEENEGKGNLTPLVVTLWYRAPELLLGATSYGPPVDVWSVGCVFGELLLGNPLFPGKGEVDQFQKICDLLGRPSPELWPNMKKLPDYGKLAEPLKCKDLNKLWTKLPRLNQSGFDLINSMLFFDPLQRISAQDALNHPFFLETPYPETPKL